MINALSDCAHPCQAMADLMTIREQRGSLAGKKLVFVGDGNNVARSLAVASAPAGRRVRPGRAAGLRVPGRLLRRGSRPGFPAFRWSSSTTRSKAVEGRRRRLHRRLGQHGAGARGRPAPRGLRPVQVNDALLARAAADAIFLHCLPAHRGEEVTSAVLDGPRSQVIPQAANRLHFQMALLLWLLGGNAPDQPTTIQESRIQNS